MHAQDEHTRWRCGGTQLGCDLKPGFSRHRDVQNDNVGVKRRSKTEGLLTVRGLTDHLESRLALENVPDPTPDDRMVVGDENADYRVGHYFAPRCMAGTRTSSKAPAPSFGLIFTLPPSAVMRSRIPAKPMCPSSSSLSGATPGGRPRPSSLTCRSTPASLIEMPMSTARA